MRWLRQKPEPQLPPEAIDLGNMPPPRPPKELLDQYARLRLRELRRTHEGIGDGREQRIVNAVRVIEKTGIFDGPATLAEFEDHYGPLFPPDGEG